jgi:hypothetical protein
VFTARYALSPYIKLIRFVFKGLNRFSGRWQKQKLPNDTMYKKHSDSVYLRERPSIKVLITVVSLLKSLLNCAEP